MSDFTPIRIIPTFILDQRYPTLEFLASTENLKGASLVGVEDAGGYYTGTTVESVLQELGNDLTGYVPYTGATAHVNLGAFNITAANLSGTNTGDQTLPTRDSLGLDTDDTVTFANLSGTNTGDQDYTNFELEMARKISGNSYMEVTESGGNITQLDYWTDDTKATKLFTKEFTYDVNDNPTTIVLTDEDTSSVLTTTIAYSSGDIINVTKVIT